MLFLIEYDRDQGCIVTIRSFGDSEREVAEDARLELELNLNLQNIENEVVLLDAASEDALRRTHRRYFETVSELMTAPTA